MVSRKENIEQKTELGDFKIENVTECVYLGSLLITTSAATR